jgi:hypothetical protein
MEAISAREHDASNKNYWLGAAASPVCTVFIARGAMIFGYEPEVPVSILGHLPDRTSDCPPSYYFSSSLPYALQDDCR